ncbi:MAG: hypothetical protein LUH22_01435 [Bacteroides sp.]|nr:hypothetical protein [Bacteroides sp.]
MKHDLNIANNKWLTHPTGDAFADLGGYVIKTLHHRFPEKNILELIEYVTKIYVDKWDAKINPFFLNSPVTQNSFKTPESKKEKTRLYFENMFNDTTSLKGICSITGQPNQLFPATRKNSILTGSGKFINFHHSFTDGIMLSKEAITRFHFVPLGGIYLQGKIALIQSNNPAIAELFAVINCNKNLEAIAKGASEGILKSPCKSAGTAIFRFIDEAVIDIKRKTDQHIHPRANNALTLYHFTNFGASPEVTLYQVPGKLFYFYTFTQTPAVKKDWNAFINSHYYSNDYKKAQYQKDTQQYQWSQKNQETFIEEADYQTWSNQIYNKLIDGKSILRDFVRWSVDNAFQFKIVETYQTYIQNMKQETISKINQMAEFILRANDKRGIEKAIKALNGARNSYQLRRFIIKDIVAKYYQEKNEEAIITVEDYANYLFPDTSSWQEIRDVLLIAIFQQLHEKDIELDKLQLENEEETEQES